MNGNNLKQPENAAEAVVYIEAYFRTKGVPATSINWSVRPAGLPKDVNDAWDILEEEQDEYNDNYTMVDKNGKFV